MSGLVEAAGVLTLIQLGIWAAVGLFLGACQLLTSGQWRHWSRFMYGAVAALVLVLVVSISAHSVHGGTIAEATQVKPCHVAALPRATWCYKAPERYSTPWLQLVVIHQGAVVNQLDDVVHQLDMSPDQHGKLDLLLAQLRQDTDRVDQYAGHQQVAHYQRR